MDREFRKNVLPKLNTEFQKETLTVKKIKIYFHFNKKP